MVLITSTPVTIAIKKAFENTQTNKNGENGKNGDKDKNLGTNLA